MNLSEQKIIKVKILNMEYTLKVDDEELGYKAAEYVDKLMNELQERLPKQPLLTIAVLTALNIAEELLREKKNRGYVESEIEDLLRNLSSRVDRILSL